MKDQKRDENIRKELGITGISITKHQNKWGGKWIL
jgi:hypothetical protein